MSEKFDRFVRDVEAQLDGLTSTQWVAQHPGEHLWAPFGEYDSCAHCMIIRRKDGKNRPCPGIVKLSLKSE